MATQKKESREFSLGDDFGPATISVNGMKLVIDENGRPTLKASGDATIITDGNITAYSTDGDVVAHTNGRVQLKAPDPEQNNEIATVTRKAYSIGDVLDDGWIVGPVSLETGNVMAIEPAETALDGYQKWFKGEDHAKELRSQGNANARQATDLELDALYNEVVKAGNNDNARFRTSISDPFGKYWSSMTDPYNSGYARIQFFDGGDRVWRDKGNVIALVRCVRDEPGLALA